MPRLFPVAHIEFGEATGINVKGADRRRLSRLRTKSSLDFDKQGNPCLFGGVSNESDHFLSRAFSTGALDFAQASSSSNMMNSWSPSAVEQRPDTSPLRRARDPKTYTVSGHPPKRAVTSLGLSRRPVSRYKGGNRIRLPQNEVVDEWRDSLSRESPSSCPSLFASIESEVNELSQMAERAGGAPSRQRWARAVRLFGDVLGRFDRCAHSSFCTLVLFRHSVRHVLLRQVRTAFVRAQPTRHCELVHWYWCRR